MKDFIPVLSAGRHDSPENGACVMEMVSLMSGDVWTDKPACTSRVIARVAQAVNDSLSQDSRHMILREFDRLFGTSDVDYNHLYGTFRNRVRSLLVTRYRSMGGYASDERMQRFLESGDYFSATSEVAYAVKYNSNLSVEAKTDMILSILTDVLDIYDEVTGRAKIEKKDVSVLASLPGQPASN